jgi:hypothetical protein
MICHSSVEGSPNPELNHHRLKDKNMLILWHQFYGRLPIFFSGLSVSLRYLNEALDYGIFIRISEVERADREIESDLSELRTIGQKHLSEGMIFLQQWPRKTSE